MDNREKFMKIDIDYIINYCVENNKVEWLKAEAAKTFVNKNGKECKASFIQIKRAFCEEFMPDIIPRAKEEKKPTMYDRIAAL